MIRTLIFSLLFTTASLSTLHAQKTAADSIRKVAIKDARAFKLKSQEVRQVKKGMISGQSDLFKPSSSTTGDALLLTDSTYNKAYRTAAYQRVIRSRTSGHYVLLGVEITGAIVVAATIVALGLGSK